MIDPLWLIASLALAVGVFIATDDWRIAAVSPVVAQLLVAGVALAVATL